MSTRTLIATAGARGAFSARYLHHGDEPEALIPLLRRMWAGTFGRDTAAMSAVLLGRDWSNLDTDLDPTHRGGPGPVLGVGWPAATSDSTPTRGVLGMHIAGPLEWLYLLYVDADVVAVYEASCHQRWLRHSLHHLNPVQELFDVDPDPAGGEPLMTVCTVCGAVDEIAYDEMPSMAGSGVDTSTACTRCGSSVATDPMFGAHVHRKPWPPPRTGRNAPRPNTIGDNR